MQLRQFASQPLFFGLGILLLAGCASPATPIPDESTRASAVAADRSQPLSEAYAERLRLGLGSPYRLIETAMRDERLGVSRSAVARMLLQRIERGALYDITPHALLAAGVPAASASAQLELIRQAIESAPDPRVGEHAVLLAYELAAAEQSIAPVLVPRVARIAALMRDRELARTDLERLREAAPRNAMALENLVLVWRAERRFLVEQPTLAVLDAAAQEEAARIALLLVGGIRAAVQSVTSVLQRPLAIHKSQLSLASATEIVTDSTPRSAQAALRIALRAVRAGASDKRARIHAPNWQQFFAAAADEERFVAALALARQDESDEIVAAGVALDAAIALRSFAQEPIVITTVTPQELASRFGVRVRFDANVTATERAHSLHLLNHALSDLRNVIRSLDLTGLTFDIGAIDADATHLAFHDPRRRVIRLDPASMAGTIAHELAHDLDWQLAFRKYNTRASYATDFATRTRRPLAYTVENLVASAAPMEQPGNEAAGARRPAEIFARRFEWYVASALAQRGRSSGYLSSVQNDWIAGYGSAVRPDPAPAAAKSFAALVAEATSMDRSEHGAVEALVIESTPVAVRVLTRAGTTTDRIEFEKRSVAEVRQWQCGGSWHAAQRAALATRWFADALAAATFRPTVAVVTPELSWDAIKLQPIRAVAPDNPLRVGGGNCNSLGVVLAQSVR